MRNGTAWYEPEMTIIQRFVMAGDVVVDLGANRGWYTRFLSNVVGEKGLVLSVEPVPGTYAILEYVVRKLRLGNVRTFQCAISDREDYVDMEIPPDTSGKANDYLARIALPGSSPQHGTVRVPAMTLDHLVTFGRKPVGFIKCDVEGHELAVLRAAVLTLNGQRPGWLIEVWGNPDEPGTQAAKTFAILSKYGYKPYVLREGVLQRRVRGDTGTRGNYFFFTKRQVERIALLSHKRANTPADNDQERQRNNEHQGRFWRFRPRSTSEEVSAEKPIIGGDA